MIRFLLISNAGLSVLNAVLGNWVVAALNGFAAVMLMVYLSQARDM